MASAGKVLRSFCRHGKKFTFGPAQSCNFKKRKVYETKVCTYLQHKVCLKMNPTQDFVKRTLVPSFAQREEGGW